MCGGDLMLDVKQAVLRLKDAGVISNAEVFRRWLRDGKVPGAVIHSKREGWQIPEDSITYLIATYKNNSSVKTDYQKGFSDGYDEGYKSASESYETKLKQLIVKGAAESTIYIPRNDFREMASSSISSENRRDFLAFCDSKIFKMGVSSARQKEDVLILGRWIYFWHAHVLMDIDDLDNENDISLSHLVVDALINDMKGKYFDAK